MTLLSCLWVDDDDFVVVSAPGDDKDETDRTEQTDQTDGVGSTDLVNTKPKANSRSDEDVCIVC